MATQESVNRNSLYSLIPLEDFKAVLGIDDREDKLSRFCLVTGTITIEQYCKRKLLHKNYFEQIEFNGNLFLPLREYPVSKFLALYAVTGFDKHGQWMGELVEPEFYRVVPDCGMEIDIPISIELSPAISRLGCKAIRAVYLAGYRNKNIPADLSAACLELASWNMNRYRGRRIGMAGNVRGGKDGERFEMSMPENVKALLEPYRRKTI